MGGTGDRFGLGGFAIRGLGGNRVLTMVDGIRVADSYSFGPFLSANRDYVDVDSLKALEIRRGPGSALYGSDALAGVVAYRSKDVEGGRVLVVPFRIEGVGPYRKVLDGLEYSAKEMGFLPHENVTR